MSNGLGGSYTTTMQSASFSDPNPMSWSLLEEQPFMDGNAGGTWACGAGQAWGIMQSGDDLRSRACTSCPPCTIDRSPTRTMIRDSGPPCCTTEEYGYGSSKSWPYAFASNTTCPKPETSPLWQELYYVRNYATEDIPITVPFNPYLL